MAKPGKIFYGWWVVLGCMLIGTTMVPPILALANKFLLQTTQEMGISRSAFTMTSTIVQLLGIFFSPFVAKRLAKGNMRRIQSISVVGFSLAYASYALATNVYHLYISSLFVGLFWLNATLIPISMMITNWFVEKRGLAMSFAMTGVSLGGFLFSPVITYFLGAYGWRMTYILMAIIVLVIALPTSLFILRKTPEDMGLQPYGVDTANKAKTAGGAVEMTLSVQEARTKPFFWLMMLGMFGTGLINAGALGQFPPALEEMHGSVVQAAIISLYSLIGVFGKIFLGWVNDRFGIVVATATGCVTFGLSFVFMMSSQLTLTYVMAVCMGIGLAIGPVFPALITGAVFGQSKYGEAYGISNSFLQIGMSIGSLFVAFIFDNTGSYHIAWLIMIVMTAVTMCGWIGSYLGARKYHSRPQANQSSTAV